MQQNWLAMLQLSWEIGKLKDLFNIDKNIYTISPDTKIISKILEIQLFPKFKTFAKKNGYEIIIAEK